MNGKAERDQSNGVWGEGCCGPTRVWLAAAAWPESGRTEIGGH